MHSLYKYLLYEKSQASCDCKLQKLVENIELKETVSPFICFLFLEVPLNKSRISEGYLEKLSFHYSRICTGFWLARVSPGIMSQAPRSPVGARRSRAHLLPHPTARIRAPRVAGPRRGGPPLKGGPGEPA